MAKDPAFLFYPGDWLGGTLGMSFEEKGAYFDMLIFQFNKGSFTEKQALSYLRDVDLWDVIKTKFSEKDGVYFNERLSEEQIKRQKYTESRRNSRLKSDEDNVRIYIVRDNIRLNYKIGSSVNPQRRYNELSNQISPSIIEGEAKDRDLTLIWYSDAVLRKEEAVLHKHFNDSRITGEWFNLSDSDLTFIFNKYKGKLLKDTNERTLKRTENENEDITINRELLDSIMSFFDFTEIANFDKMRDIRSFLICLTANERISHFEKQFESYSKLINKDPKFKHSFLKFIGKAKELFEDGIWNAENWTEKYNQKYPQKTISKFNF